MHLCGKSSPIVPRRVQSCNSYLGDSKRPYLRHPKIGSLLVPYHSLMTTYGKYGVTSFYRVTCANNDGLRLMGNNDDIMKPNTRGLANKCEIQDPRRKLGMDSNG